MLRERTALEKRNKSMEESYYIYRTTWAEDWPQFCEVTFFRDLFREKIQNKFEIFSLFYPIIGIAISFVISIVVVIISKRFLIGALAFVVLALVVILAYSIYFSVLAHRVKKLNSLIGHFYTKYGRLVMKDLYKKYRPDDLPPQPERYYNLNEGEEETEERGDQDEAETAEEKTEATDTTSSSTDGIDLRLKQHGSSDDDVVATRNVVVDDNSLSREAEEDEESDRTRKPESPVSEEAEGDEVDGGETFVEAVNVIDAELPADDTDPQLQRPSETLHDDVISDDGVIDDESEIELILGEDESDEVPENPKLTLADLFDDFSDEDYREEPEEELAEEEAETEETEATDEELTEKDTVEENVETANPEIVDEETVEEKYDAEAEETEETEELTETEGGEENGRLFPEGYNPTIAELRAALRALMRS